MAKDKKDKKAAKADTKGKAAEKEVKEKTPEFKYGVSDLAEKLDIKEASVRVQLRNKGVAKAGKSYGWNSKSDLDDVVSQLKTKDESPKADKKAKGDDKAAKSDKKKDKKAKKSKKSDD
jgi:hypothetical protein